MRSLWITACAALLFDQIAKIWVVFGLDLQSRISIEVFPPYLVFQMGWNRGVNFGLLGGDTQLMRWALIAVAVVISVWLVVWARRNFHRPLAFVAAGLVVGGALSNALDRVIYGAVADFLSPSCCGFNNPYTFNTADVFIFAGAIGLVLLPSDEKTP